MTMSWRGGNTELTGRQTYLTATLSLRVYSTRIERDDLHRRVHVALNA